MLELCFDGSQVSIRNHDIFAAYAPTVSGGVGTSCEGVATYLPPVRVPELAWRGRDSDEPITVQDTEWWESRGWLSRRGVQAYQAVRAVQPRRRLRGKQAPTAAAAAAAGQASRGVTTGGHRRHDAA